MDINKREMCYKNGKYFTFFNYIRFHVWRVIVIDLSIAGFSYCHWNAYHANFKTIACILEFDLWLIAQLLQKINFDL